MGERKDKVTTIDGEVMNGWKNVASNCKRVRAGEMISVQVQGGWSKKVAPYDGYVFESGESQIYVPIHVLRRKRK